MRYFKVVNDGRILGVGTTTGDARCEISADEFNVLSGLFANSPGDGYALMESTLTWDAYEPPVSEEISDTEALTIIMGGAT